MITRPFKTIHELNTMITGYEMLFNAAPTLALTADGTVWSGNDPIFIRRPLPVLHIGRKVITIQVDGEQARIWPDAQFVQLSVVFE